MGNVIPLAGSAPLQVPIELIDPPDQPLRIEYEGEEGELEELGRSMLESGQQNPINVFKIGGRYQCVLGDRRLRAALTVQASMVWISIIDPRDEISTIALQIEENIHRKSLDPYEEACAYVRMLDLGLTVSEIAGRVKKDAKYVRERLQFASASASVHEHVVAGRLTPTKAAYIARLPDGEEQAQVAESAVADKLTTTQVRELVEQTRMTPRSGRPRRYLSPDKTLLEAARVNKWLQRVGKNTNFKALTGDNIKALRQVFGDEMISNLRMLCDLLDRVAKGVPSTSSDVPATHRGNVPTERNYGEVWSASDVAKVEAWVNGKRICPVEMLAEELGRTVTAVQDIAKQVRVDKRSRR